MLESACSTDEEFTIAISHMASLIKPGGTFITYTTLEATYFNFDGFLFPDYYITDARFISALEAAGLEIVHTKYANIPLNNSVSDCQTVGLYVAKKKHQ